MRGRTAAAFAHCPWMRIAHEYEGLRELDAQGELNPLVRDFFRQTRFPLSLVNKYTSWCAAFVCTVLHRAGLRHPRSAKAYDFLDSPHFVRLRAPVLGSILVFDRTPDNEKDELGHAARAGVLRGQPRQRGMHACAAGRSLDGKAVASGRGAATGSGARSMNDRDRALLGLLGLGVLLTWWSSLPRGLTLRPGLGGDGGQDRGGRPTDPPRPKGATGGAGGLRSTDPGTPGPGVIDVTNPKVVPLEEYQRRQRRRRARAKP